MDTIIKTLENHEERLNKHDAEIAKLKKDVAKLKKDILYLKNELRREISDLKEYQKELEDIIFKVIKAMDENGSVFEDDDLFIIADLMKN